MGLIGTLRPLSNLLADATLTVLPGQRGMFCCSKIFADRFVIGADVDPATMAAYAEEIGYRRGIRSQLSSAPAAKLAHVNAERLLKLLSASTR